MSTEKKSVNWLFVSWGILIVGVIAVFIIAGFSSGSSSQKYKDSYGHDKYDAIAIAETKVKGQLKSPSTAKFCKISEYTVSLSGDTWTVKGYVDAQNGFGATLRSDFIVRFTFTSSSKYTVDLLSIK